MSEFVSPFTLSYAYKRSLGPVGTRFATGLVQGTFFATVTKEGRVLCPPRAWDPETGASVTDAWREVGPGGTVESWTDGLALIKLDGADTALLHKVDGEVATGDRVLPVWSEERTGRITDVLHFSREGGPARTPLEEVEPVWRFKAPTRIDYTVEAGAITRTFLEAILEKRLLGLRCPSCTKVYIPPRGSCPTCAVTPTERVELSQRGTVTTFSVIRIPFEGQLLEPPYACAHIVLDGADVPLLHIVGDCPPDEVRMGMRVEAVWEDPPKPTLSSVRYFRPVDEPDTDYESYREHV